MLLVRVQHDMPRQYGEEVTVDDFIPGFRFAKSADPRLFWEQAGPPGCWEWSGARDKDGYGQTRSRMGGRVKAHRRAWEIAYGSIPQGFLVCHRCDNPPCVRPDHLYLGTALQNQTDRWDRGVTRSPRRFTPEQVRDIRRRYATGTIRQRELAEEYDTRQAVISRVIHRRTYAEVR